MIDRRKFLERSVLSTGSVLFSSALLQSCTKYGIPLPGGGPHPGGGTPPPLTPPLLGSNINWNDDAKTMITTGLEMIPEAGALLGGLVDIFWPSTQEDVWGKIKDQVEAFVDQKIAANVYQQVRDDLGKLEPIPSGLIGVITLYLNEVKNGGPEDIKNQWSIARSAFVGALPHFQSPGNEVLLLPLFAQFANMYLGLLRDGVAFGLSWGRTVDKDHPKDIQDLKDAITAFSRYTQDTYNTGRSAWQKKAPYDYHHREPFKTVNTYDRQMSPTVLDFMDTWKYYDVSQSEYKDGVEVVLTREIYSDPYGTADDSGPIVLPSAPTQLPTNITVWGGAYINTVQLTYPQGSGPGGVTQTNRMGAGVGSNHWPAGGSFNITAENPIYTVRVRSGSVVNAMAFITPDDWDQPLDEIDWMGGPGGNDSGWINYTNRALSSIHINGESRYYGCADLVVFGFQTWKYPAETMRAIRALYVKTPKEKSAADFAKAFPKLAIPANLIAEELKAARKAYWAYIKARAEEIK